MEILRARDSGQDGCGDFVSDRVKDVSPVGGSVDPFLGLGGLTGDGNVFDDDDEEGCGEEGHEPGDHKGC